MARYIPVKCAEIDAVPGNPARGVLTHIEFTIPQLQYEIVAEFIPSRTRAAISRATKIAELAISGAPEDEIVSAVEAYIKPAKRVLSGKLTDKELAEFMAENGWISLDEIAEDEVVATGAAELSKIAGSPVEDVPGRRSGESLEEYWDRTIGPRDTVVTSDGRYVVDPAARTVSPVEDIPEDIVAVMPVWEISDSEISFWPRSFDIPAGMDETFKYEEIAARLLLIEIAHIVWGLSDDELMFTSDGEYSIAPAPSCQMA